MDLRSIVRTMRIRYPSLRLIYLSSRTYGGYAITGLNPEPAAYDSGYAVRGVIQYPHGRQAQGAVARLGPVSLDRRPARGRSDGLIWSCDDVEEDGTHPSKTGVQKVVNQLINVLQDRPHGAALVRQPLTLGRSGRPSVLSPR